ncbi:MAG: DNA cytosine methyltransferase, partial [Alphaproteobacteria bacterium]|nr:DNA cytosine methyltransferase [Alphaproteobacteria bacterium]
MSFSFLSVCSGIEGASLAFAGLGATCVGVAETGKFPAAVIAHRYGSNLPGEPLSRNAPPNFGDFTQLVDPDSAARAHLAGKRIDVLIGGTPCQAFSVAGKRLSLEDARGNLTLAFAVLAHELARSHGLRNAVWENVPGALNTKDNAFGCFLCALVGSERAIPDPKGRGWPDAGMVDGPRARAAWIVRDAQYFGVPQRRARVFLVVDFGDGADPAEVLFEPQGLRGNSAPRREAGEGIAATLAASPGGCSGKDAIDGRVIASTDEISHNLCGSGVGGHDYGG